MSHSRPVLVVAAVVLLLVAGWAAWDRRAHIGSQAAAGERLGSADVSNTKSNHSTSAVFAKRFANELPPHLIDLVYELEKRCEALSHDMNHLELLEAQEAARPLIERLSAKDVRILLEFYQRDHRDPLLGDWLCESHLYEAWGRLDPDSAMDWFREQLRDRSGDGDGPLDVADPFEDHPPAAELGLVFKGWARRDPAAAWRGWNRVSTSIGTESGTSLAPIAAGGILETWSGRNPRQAWEFLWNELEPELATECLDGFVAGLPVDAPWPWLVTEFEERRLQTFVLNEKFAAKWARHDPEAAIAWIDEQDGSSAWRVYQEWFWNDVPGQAMDWLNRNSPTLDPDLRLQLVKMAVAARKHHFDEIAPLFATLPRNNTTWRMLEILSGGLNEDRIDPAYQENRAVHDRLDYALPDLGPDAVAQLVQELHPPDEIRTYLERRIARLREEQADRDPFANDY